MHLLDLGNIIQYVKYEKFNWLITKTIDLLLCRRVNFAADQSRIEIEGRERSNTQDLY